MRRLSEDEIRLLTTMKSTMDGLIPCAIYARKSKEDRSQEALNVQVEVCQKMIDANPEFLELKTVYQEDDASGKDIAGREAFKKMLEEAEEGTIRVILVSKWDRLARSAQDAITLRNDLPKKGVLIITIEDTGQQDAVSTLNRDIMSAISQFYLHKISEDTKSVLIAKALKGQSAGGRANFGYEYYKNEQGEIRLRQDPLEAPIVKEIFDKFNFGSSYQDIIDDFKKRNIMTRDGNQFTRSTIHDILRNVKYSGVYRYNRQDRKPSAISAKHFDEVWVEGGIEDPIITKEAFELTQSLLKQATGQKKTSDYLLTGIMECAKCGTPMVGSSQSRGKGKPRVKYYICPNHSKNTEIDCSNKGIAAEKIETVVEDAVLKVVKAFVKSKHFDNAKIATLTTKHQARIKSHNTTIKNHEATKKKIMDLLLDDPSDTHEKALNERLEETQSKIDNLKSAVEGIQAEIATLKSVQTQFKTGTLTKDKLFPNIPIKKQIIKAFVDRIQFGDDIIIDILEENEGSQ